MSDTGVFANRYSHLRRIGDLLDEFLLQARSQTGAPAAVAKRLAELLDQGNAGRINPLLELTITMAGQPQPLVADLAAIAVSLRQGNLSTMILDQLETLARSIDARLSETAAQMRGLR